jgi:hypothetical protein
MISLPKEAFDVMSQQVIRLSRLCNQFIEHQAEVNRNLAKRIEELEKARLPRQRSG